MALFVIAGSVELISALTKLVRQEIVKGRDSIDLDWQIFCNQLRNELDGSEFVKIEGNFLYVNKGSSQWRFGKVGLASDFRKTNADGRGYQPMLFGISALQISENEKLIKINFEMEGGGKKLFYYKF
ncbi:MAG: competence protein ComGF [Streptococcaceae bacterium]|nr:competence protein ComGF [Streptococcaceae bacterium]